MIAHCVDGPKKGWVGEVPDRRDVILFPVPIKTNYLASTASPYEPELETWRYNFAGLDRRYSYPDRPVAMFVYAE